MTCFANDILPLIKYRIFRMKIHLKIHRWWWCWWWWRLWLAMFQKCIELNHLVTCKCWTTSPHIITQKHTDTFQMFTNKVNKYWNNLSIERFLRCFCFRVCARCVNSSSAISHCVKESSRWCRNWISNNWKPC